MFLSYGSVVFAIAPEETVRFRYVLGTGFLPFGVRIVIQLFYKIRSNQDKGSLKHFKCKNGLESFINILGERALEVEPRRSLASTS
ncbi:hypothetical protein LguiA_010204 [Lonicera macranthoides]